MAIPAHHRANFDTLVRAAQAGDLALMEAQDAASGEPRYILVAVSRDGDSFEFTPFGHLHDGNPYAAYVPAGAKLIGWNLVDAVTGTVWGVYKANGRKRAERRLRQLSGQYPDVIFEVRPEVIPEG